MISFKDTLNVFFKYVYRPHGSPIKSVNLLFFAHMSRTKMTFQLLIVCCQKRIKKICLNLNSFTYLRNAILTHFDIRIADLIINKLSSADNTSELPNF